MVETKGGDRMENQDTKSKLKSAFYFIENINKFDLDDRDNRVWHYVLLSDENFYSFQAQNGNIEDMLKYFKVIIDRQDELF